jgi:hypothetical protein
MTLYIITSNNKTLIHKPKKMWIFANQEEAQNFFDMMCENDGWSMPEYKEIERVYFKDKDKKEREL